MLAVGFLDHLPMIRQGRHWRRDRVAVPALERYRRPIRLEAEFAVRISEAVEVMRGVKIRLAIDPALGLERGERAPAGFLQTGIDQLPRRHVEAGMLGAKPCRQAANHLVIVAAFA